jgi:hypothetical protein
VLFRLRRTAGAVRSRHVLRLPSPDGRFQFEGPGEAFTSQLRSIAEGPVDVEVVRTVPTANGFVTEHIDTQHLPDGEVVARRIHLCEVSEGRICAVVTYCNGGWDAEL